MKIKRFIAQDARNAMAQVRSELGDQAVILSNKTINGQVELVAAIDLDEVVSGRVKLSDLPEQNKTVQKAFFEKGAFKEGALKEGAFREGALKEGTLKEATPDNAHSYQVNSPTAVSHTATIAHANLGKAPSISKDPNLTDNQMLMSLQEEMGNLRSILETELSQLAWRDMAALPPVKAALTNRLMKLGLSRKLCGDLVDNLPVKGDLREQWVTTLGMLARKLPVAGDKLIDEGGIVALVGSTGVGKTTTIAKLAARCIMRHGTRDVGLITTDCYRIGGQEQLQTFAKYLDIPLLVATDSDQIRAALDQFSSRRLVLIDTAGMSQRDVRLYEQFSTLKATGYPIDAYAVLSATALPGTSQEIVRVFSANALTGCIITKLDESTCLGSLLDIVIRHQLKVGYVSNGQKVPEDIVPARAENLVARAVELMESETRRQAELEREFKNQPIAV